MTVKEMISIHKNLEFKHFDIEVTPNWKYKTIHIWLSLNAEVKLIENIFTKYAECQIKEKVISIWFNPKYTVVYNNPAIEIKELMEQLPLTQQGV
jgi:hypothetical protein